MGVEDVRGARHKCEKHSRIVRHVKNKERATESERSG